MISYGKCMIGIPEVDDSESKMNIHPIVGSATCSLTEEWKRLCDDEVIINDVKSCTKFKKGEEIKTQKNSLLLAT